MRKFESDGMLWDDGDIPQCDFCSSTIDEVETLHETPFSGELCCDKQECRETLIENVLNNQVEETTNQEVWR